MDLSSCLALALCAQVSATRLGPARDVEPEPLPLRFVAVGDYGTTLPGSFALAALVHALEPRLVITLGDNNYPDGAAATIDANVGQHFHDYIHPYAGSYGSGAAVNRFFPCLGNHDWLSPGAAPYLAYFELPGNERYYSVRRGPVELFALDSDLSEPDGILASSAQAAWLQAALAASSAPFRIVYLHHAPYSSSAVHGSQGLLQWPFRAWGASLVLAGHDHLYERASVSGLPYVVCGLGGNVRYPFGPPIGGSALRFNATEGCLLAVADEESLRLQLVTTGDAVVDDFVLPRGGIDPGSTTLVAEGATWRFLDTGVDPGATWTALAFDDSGWAQGPAQLGYGDGDEATVVGFGGDPQDKHVTTWFRHAFSVADPAAFGELQLRVLHDDGAVVHVNGTEVGRYDMPAGPITSATLASVAIGGQEELTFDPLTVDPAVLVAGTNVVAVEVHQASPTSSDVSFALELVGLGAGTTLLPAGATWRYLDTGVDPGAQWSTPGFDDQAWSSGPAPLGFGEGDESTTTAPGAVTTWFRATFSLADASAVGWLECSFERDDGLVVWLNGHEAARIDLPRGAIDAGTLAPFDVEGVPERTSLDPRLLVDGTNTVAVEVHQSSAASDDLSFDLALVAH